MLEIIYHQTKENYLKGVKPTIKAIIEDVKTIEEAKRIIEELNCYCVLQWSYKKNS